MDLVGLGSKVLPSLLAPLGRRLLDWLAGFRSPQTLALRRYQRRLARRYGTFVPESGTPEDSIAMQDGYLPLQVEDNGRKRRVEQVLAERGRVVVTGEPGAGKSMLLRYLAFAFAEGGRQARRGAIPVIVGLQEAAGADLETGILRQLRAAKFFRADKFLARALRTGKLRVLLDGLDEVSHQQRADTVRRILAFFEEYGTCEVVVTCRTAVREEALWRRMYAVEVAELDDTLIRQFVRRWLGTSESRTEALLDELFGKPRVLALARVPLLLTMMARLYASTGRAPIRLPASRASFYREVIDFLLTPWHAERDTYSGHIDDKRKVLNQLALTGQDSSSGDWLVFDRRAAHAQATAVLDEDKGAVRELFREIVERSGLLRIVHGRYQFAHLSFQDYLAAETLDEDGLLARFAHDPDRWQEPAVLWCGLADDATQVVGGLLRGGSLAALECVGEAREVDEALARSVVAHFAPALDTAGADDPVVRAFGAAASGVSAAARAVFAFLRDQVTRPGRRRAAAAHALAVSGLPEAAVVLGQLYGSTPEVREPLARMGDLAVDALAADGGEDALNGLAAIGTPAALHTLVDFLWHDDERAARAAWRVGALISEPQLEAELARHGRLGLSTHDYGWVWAPFSDDQTTRTIVSRVSHLILHGPVEDGPAIDPRLAIALGFIAPEHSLTTAWPSAIPAELADLATRLRAIDNRVVVTTDDSLPWLLLEERADPNWRALQRRYLDAYLRWRQWPARAQRLLMKVPTGYLTELFAKYYRSPKPSRGDWKNMLRQGAGMLSAAIGLGAVFAFMAISCVVLAVVQTIRTFFPEGGFSLDAVSWLRSAGLAVADLAVWLWNWGAPLVRDAAVWVGTEVAGLLRPLADVEILFFDLRVLVLVVLGIGVLWLGWAMRDGLGEAVFGLVGVVLLCLALMVVVVLLVLLATMPSVWVHAVTGSWLVVAAAWVVTVAAPVATVVVAEMRFDRTENPLRDGIAALRPVSTR
jgi:hypothetical protein